MSPAKSYASFNPKGPSILALLIDDIVRMTPSEQRLLWMELNKQKLTTLAKMMDSAVTPHQLSSSDIDTLIQETKKNAGKKKKG